MPDPRATVILRKLKPREKGTGIGNFSRTAKRWVEAVGTGRPRFSEGSPPKVQQTNAAAPSKPGGELFEAGGADSVLEECFEPLHLPDESQLIN